MIHLALSNGPRHCHHASGLVTLCSATFPIGSTTVFVASPNSGTTEFTIVDVFRIFDIECNIVVVDVISACLHNQPLLDLSSLSFVMNWLGLRISGYNSMLQDACQPLICHHACTHTHTHTHKKKKKKN